MTKQQFIWVGAVIGLGFGILIWAQGPGNYMMAELIGAGLPVALFGTALIAVGAAFIRKKKMKSVASIVIAITAVGAYPLSYADIYKCTINGEVFFSAEKCGHDAVKINTDPPPNFTIRAGPPPTMIGLGPTKTGFHQLHKQSIRGVGTKSASGWVWATLSSESGVADKAKALAVMYLADCAADTVYPIIWNAYREDGKLAAEGTHGKYMKRTVHPETLDAEIYKYLCPKN